GRVLHPWDDSGLVQTAPHRRGAVRGGPPSASDTVSPQPLSVPPWPLSSITYRTASRGVLTRLLTSFYRNKVSGRWISGGPAKPGPLSLSRPPRSSPFRVAWSGPSAVSRGVLMGTKLDP